MDDKKSPPPDDEKSEAGPASTTRPATADDPFADTEGNSALTSPPPYTPIDPNNDSTAEGNAPGNVDTDANDIYEDAAPVDHGDESSDEDIWQLTAEDLKVLEEMESKPLEPTPAPPSTSNRTTAGPPSETGHSRPNPPSRPSSSNQITFVNNNRHSSPSTVDMCPMCGVRPKFAQGFTVYPTCGQACYDSLASMQGYPDLRHGQMMNPNHSSNSSSPRHSAGGFISSLFHPAPQPLKMCKVCGVRPRCQRGDRIFPTCGLTCAAKLNPPGSTEMCEYCKQRPKVIANGRMYPHCGRTCRDKARAAESASATASSSASCTTCLNCWRGYANPPKEDFCSLRCKGIIERRSPMLLEVPRGHLSFKAVEDTFKASWGQQKHPCPSVKKVYMVIMNPSQIARFDEYCATKATSKKKGGELRWIGNPRECGIGDSGNMSPCGSPRCLMCIVLRASHTRQKPGGGIPTTSLAKAAEISSNVKKRTSHVVMLTKIQPGKIVELEQHELREPLPPPGYDSVRMVGYHHSGRKVDLDELIVYDCDALRPVYCVSFE